MGYADNILRGFSTAIATANSLLLSMWCFGLEVHGIFYFGTAMVICATMLYVGIVNLPGNWWNTAPSHCGVISPSVTEQELKNVEKYDCVPTSEPLPQVAGRQVSIGSNEFVDSVSDEGAQLLNGLDEDDEVIHSKQGDEVIHPDL